MDVLQVVGKAKMYGILSNIKYGYIYVMPDKSAFEMLTVYVDAVDSIRRDALRLTKALKTDYIDGRDVQSEIDGVFTIVWADRYSEPTVLSEKEVSFLLYLKKLTAEEVKGKKINIETFNPLLLRYIKKEAGKIGLKYKSGFLLNELNNKSAYKTIEDAIHEGLPYVDFLKTEVNPQTIRVYSSQISKFSGKTTSVTIIGDVVRLYIEDKNTNYWNKEINKLFIAMSRDIKKNEAVKLFRDYLDSLGIVKNESEAFNIPLKPELISFSENLEAYNNQAPAVYEDPDDVPEYRIFGYNSQHEFDEAQQRKARAAYVPKPAFVLDPVPAPQDDSDMVILTDEEIDWNAPWVAPVEYPQTGTDHIGLWRIDDGIKIYDHRFEYKVAEVDGLKQYVALLDEVSQPEPVKKEWSLD